MVISKESINIKGYPKPFERVIKFSKRDKLFSTTCPKLVVSENITELEYLYAQSYKDIEDKFSIARREFEALQEDFKLVINYKIDEQESHKDGSGVGFVLLWGVFKEIEHKNRYHWVRGYGQSMSYYWHDNFGRDRGWRTIEWTQDRELFFIDISEKLDKLVEGLAMFLTQENIEDAIAKTGKALTSGLTVE